MSPNLTALASHHPLARPVQNQKWAFKVEDNHISLGTIRVVKVGQRQAYSIEKPALPSFGEFYRIGQGAQNPEHMDDDDNLYKITMAAPPID